MPIADLATPGTIAAVSAVALPGARWALNLWATVRRETMAAAIVAAAKREAFEAGIAAAASRDSARMVDALLAQATAAAQLAGAQAALTARIDQLSNKLDGIAKAQEWTPVEGMPTDNVPRYRPEETPSERSRKNRRAMTPIPAPGYRAPTRGGHDDNDT